MNLSQEDVRGLFEYRDGVLWNKVDRPPRGMAGKQAGNVSTKGYLVVRCSGKTYQAHNLIWIWHFGAIPTGYVIDHKDRNPLNNRVENLRLATASDNATNKTRQSNNSSGVTGVRWHNLSLNPMNGSYLGRVRSKGRTVNASFSVKQWGSRGKALEEAIAWRNRTAEQMQGEFAVHSARVGASIFEQKRVEVGVGFRNYVELCGVLGEEVLFADSKVKQLRGWSEWFRWERYGHGYLVVEVLRDVEQMPRYEKRGLR